MRQDQYEKLQALTEKLTDAFLGEADPEAWPGHGVGIAVMDQQTRGDRYWCKKNAAATLSVLVRTTNLIGIVQMRGGVGGTAPTGDPDPDDGGLDADIKAAEKEAAKLMSQLQKKGHVK